MVLDFLLGQFAPKKPQPVRPTRAWSNLYRNSGTIATSDFYHVDVSDDDYYQFGQRLGGFMVCVVNNRSSEQLWVKLDNSDEKGGLVQPGQQQSFNGMPFRDVKIQNLSAATISANEIYVTVAQW